MKFCTVMWWDWASRKYVHQAAVTLGTWSATKFKRFGPVGSSSQVEAYMKGLRK